MNVLCAQIAIEKDQDKFIQLVQELNNLMEKERAPARELQEARLKFPS
jgi:hypothetical protein